MDGVAYVSTTGNVCFVTVARKRDRRAGRALPENFATCPATAERIASKLDRTPAVVAGIRAANPALVVGYAAENVEHLAVTTPDGRSLAVKVSDPWEPGAPGSVPIRIFVASSPSYLDSIGRPADGASGDPRRYDIRVWLDNGQTVRVR